MGRGIAAVRGPVRGTDRSVLKPFGPRFQRAIGAISVDPQKFEDMVRKLFATLSRRSLVGGSIGASMLAAVGLGEEAEAEKVGVEACIQTGKRCPSPKPRGRRGGRRGGRRRRRGRRAKQLTCDQCCQRRVTTNAKGQNICYCAPEGTQCSQTRECCDGRCIGGTCQLCQLVGESCNDFTFGGVGCCEDLRCNQATETTSGVCVACLPDGATCNPDAPNNLCCGRSSFCNPETETCEEFGPQA